MQSSSKLYMADLAGSERVSRSKVSGVGMQEALAINSSLTALGKCIKSLTERASHIPFRESKLTYILQVLPSAVCACVLAMTAVCCVQVC